MVGGAAVGKEIVKVELHAIEPEHEIIFCGRIGVDGRERDNGVRLPGDIGPAFEGGITSGSRGSEHECRDAGSEEEVKADSNYFAARIHARRSDYFREGKGAQSGGAFCGGL